MVNARSCQLFHKPKSDTIVLRFQIYFWLNFPFHGIPVVGNNVSKILKILSSCQNMAISGSIIVYGYFSQFWHAQKFVHQCLIY